MCVISVAKCTYLKELSVFRCEMFTVSTVSSIMLNLLFTLSRMWFEVGHNFISCPSMSPNTVYFVVLPCTVDWSH